jgi:hypothetical protein
LSGPGGVHTVFGARIGYKIHAGSYLMRFEPIYKYLDSMASDGISPDNWSDTCTRDLPSAPMALGALGLIVTRAII